MIEYLYAGLTILAGFIGAILILKIFGFLEKKAATTENQMDDILFASIKRPLAISSIFISIYYALLQIPLPADYSWLVDAKAFNVAFIIIATWIISSFFHNFVSNYGKVLCSKTDSELDDKIFSILESSIKYIIWFLGFVYILNYLEIEITPIIASAGVASIAITFAAKDIISNFFGGAMILADKPFEVGDRVKINGELGDIVSVGVRSTRVKTLNHQLLTIPNSVFSTSIVTNYAMPDVKLKVKIPVSVAYGSDVKRVKEVLMEIAEEAAKEEDYILENPAPSVYFLEYGQSSLNYMMVIWAGRFNMSWEVMDKINFLIDEKFREEGIEIPFPQMDVHLKKDFS
ncbi:mechanosensitive ion channel family protein [Methanolacinia paynteri]|uniref:mechanosensitive ion channel family protein n=1 Tax=Methanolacinia paynteri TaxID=230356 RepID=UPI00064EB636|nr:mechanosensitive ion channel domain-containing protein [Methanolacinia paynteri]